MTRTPPVLTVLVFAAVVGPFGMAFAQAPLPGPLPPAASVQPPPSFPPAEIERIVSPIALYPDPLLAQVLAAATFAEDVPEAARWADEHHFLTGTQLAQAIAADDLTWDPSVQALLPFPSVLEMMASAMPWTREVGDAFLAQPSDVMDAVQRLRQRAFEYGYLRSNTQVVVRNGPYLEIEPANPSYITVPYYDPQVVFLPPRPGVVVVGAIGFRFGVAIGAWFGPWGWGTTSFGWPTHTVIINRAPWGRSWLNRSTYVHPYQVPRYRGPRLPEEHRAIPRTPVERGAGRSGERAREVHPTPPREGHPQGQPQGQGGQGQPRTQPQGQGGQGRPRTPPQGQSGQGQPRAQPKKP